MRAAFLIDGVFFLTRLWVLKEMTERDVKYDVRQKGVDMRIGLDIASRAYKKLVDQIILVAGDSDFVPAAKLARREGIDFLLDPMWASIREDLHEHIDGVCSVFPRPGSQRRATDPGDSPSPPQTFFGAGYFKLYHSDIFGLLNFLLFELFSDF